jgi:hypothetical protein
LITFSILLAAQQCARIDEHRNATVEKAWRRGGEFMGNI